MSLSWHDVLFPPKPDRPAPVAGPITPAEGQTKYVASALAREVERVRSAAKGTRNDTLNTAAFKMATLIAAGVLDYDTTRETLLAAGQAVGLSQVEASKTIASGLRGGRDKPRDLSGVAELAAPNVTEVDAAGVTGDGPGEAEAAEPVVATWRPLDLAAYLDGTHQPPVPSLFVRDDGHALFYGGLTHSLHGESESGKSLICQACACRVLNDGGRVLLLDFESDPVSVVERLIALGARPDAIRAGLVYVNPETSPYGTPAERQAWQEILDDRFDLAIIDGVTASLGLFGGATKDNDTLTEWARLLPDRIARHTGAAVVSVDHVVKDAEGRGRFAIGGQAKMAALTGAAYTVEPVQPLGRGLRGVVALRVAKDRPGYVRAHAGQWRAKDRTQEAARVVIDSTGPATVVMVEPPRTGDDPAVTRWRPTAIMENLSRKLEAETEPLSLRRTTALIVGKDEHKRQALAELIAGGYVTVTDGPRNAQLHTSTSPYRQADDPESDAYDGGTHSARESVAPSVSTVSVSYTPGHGTQWTDRVPGTVGTRSGHGRSHRLTAPEEDARLERVEPAGELSDACPVLDHATHPRPDACYTCKAIAEGGGQP